jgi:hypothetical protein
MQGGGGTKNCGGLRQIRGRLRFFSRIICFMTAHRTSFSLKRGCRGNK